ncbi:MAG: helix-turn-helix transcriptional regulator [Candidatus Binataceae bacterium]
MGADTVGLNVVNIARRRISIYLDPSPEQLGVKEFEARAGATMHEHPLIAHFQRTADTHATRLSDFLSRRQLCRLRIYHELMKPLGIEHLTAAPLIDPSNGDQIAISLGRTCADFTDRELATLEVLQIHILHAYRNAQAVSEAERSIDQARNAIERSSNTAVILISDGVVSYTSRRSEQFIEKYFPCDSRITPSRLPQTLDLWLRSWLSALADKSELLSPIEPREVSAETGRLEIRLFTGDRPGDLSLLLSESDARGDLQLLQERLGLNPREAAALLWIARGKTSAETAVILSISRRTVDKHLEHIYQKLGVESRVAAAARVWQLLRRPPDHQNA